MSLEIKHLIIKVTSLLSQYIAEKIHLGSQSIWSDLLLLWVIMMSNVYLYNPHKPERLSKLFYAIQPRAPRWQGSLVAYIPKELKHFKRRQNSVKMSAQYWVYTQHCMISHCHLEASLWLSGKTFKTCLDKLTLTYSNW